jgi:hypothetical protein
LRTRRHRRSAALYRNGHAIRQEMVRSMRSRRGRRRAYDLLCTAIDTDPPLDPTTNHHQQPVRSAPGFVRLGSPGVMMVLILARFIRSCAPASVPHCMVDAPHPGRRPLFVVGSGPARAPWRRHGT